MLRWRGPKNVTMRPLVRGMVPSHNSPIAAPNSSAIPGLGGRLTKATIIKPRNK